MAQQIVWEIRLPRTVGAWLAGALLGLAGAVAQGLFRNPLADPYLLGSASGASLGVALALVALGGGGGMLGGSMMNGGVTVSVFSSSVLVRLGLTGAAFAGAVLAVLLGDAVTLPLLLAGGLMALGVWLHLSERHVHPHSHEALVHEHKHAHDEHHQHAHDLPVAPGTSHSHPHRHEPLMHCHPHYPDAHHRHKHQD